MAREISRAESYERAHEIFTQVNFNSFDYASIKESLLDYIKLYYPEDFNDYIESSEFIALLEIFAYATELMAYRIDTNAHENFITTAQRKESILRLAKLISYNSSRNIPSRGLVKLSSIQTTETIIDSQGRNLAGKQIIWNDSNNSDWKEQFLLIMNRVLEQDFGTVNPNERVQIDDVLFELYTWNNKPLNVDGRAVFSYSVTTNGQGFPMELVPAALDTRGPREKRPERNLSFSLLYANDGLGDSSDTTGFMLFTKQGTLQLLEKNYDGITPNQTTDILTVDINETDIYINNVNADSREVLLVDPVVNILPHLVSADLRFGEWISVDLSNAQNILFNTNLNRNKYEIETLADDQIRIIYGDGEFSTIPSGAFDIWYRTSANTNISIPRSAIIDKSSSFTYVDQGGAVQTLSFKFSLISSLQNSSKSEDIEHVRNVAPSVYYSQDRMVNGRDYNTFMLQDPTILKLRSVNRTFAGDSKYIAWHDPSEYYENVKLFGDDAALYWNEQAPTNGALHVITTPESAESVIHNYMEPLLCSSDFFSAFAPRYEVLGKNPAKLRCVFNGSSIPYSFNSTTNEVGAIAVALTAALVTTPIVDIYYSVEYDEWTVGIHPCDSGTPPISCTGVANSYWMFRIEARFAGSNLSGWDVHWRTRRMLVHSKTTKFYNPNLTGAVVDFDTLNSRLDRILMLKANATAEQTGILSSTKTFTVIGQELVEQNLPNSGLPDEHKLSILPIDTNGDGVPDNLTQGEIFDATYLYTIDGTEPTDNITGNPVITIPQQKFYIGVMAASDVIIHVNGLPYTFGAAVNGWTLADIETNITRNLFTFSSNPPVYGDIITIEVKDYVYFYRKTLIDSWEPQPNTKDVATNWSLDTTISENNKHNKRYAGRYPLNFAWLHTTPRFHLIDPAASNIIDTFIVTKGYHTDLVRYLENKSDIPPDLPTSLSLRTTYATLLDNRMISDSVILHPGKFKILFGHRADPEIRAIFKVVRPTQHTLTDNEVKVRVVSSIREFFNINNWEFGETFYYTELAASIHAILGPEIDSIVIVPTFNQNQFGDLFQIQAREDEMFIADVSTSDVQIVQSLTRGNINQ